MGTQAAAYFKRDPERDEFYRIFYKICRQYNVVWSNASPEVKAFVEEATRVAYEQKKVKESGCSSAKLRLFFDPSSAS